MPSYLKTDCEMSEVLESMSSRMNATYYNVVFEYDGVTNTLSYHIDELILRYDNVFKFVVFDTSNKNGLYYNSIDEKNTLGIDSLLWKVYTNKLQRAVDSLYFKLSKLYGLAGGRESYVDDVDITGVTMVVVDGKAVLSGLTIN